MSQNQTTDTCKRATYDTFRVIQPLMTERITTENAYVIYLFARTVHQNRQNMTKLPAIRQILRKPM